MKRAPLVICLHILSGAIAVKWNISGSSTDVAVGQRKFYWRVLPWKLWDM